MKKMLATRFKKGLRPKCYENLIIKLIRLVKNVMLRCWKGYQFLRENFKLSFRNQLVTERQSKIDEI